ncbi:MAG: ACP phosphodiesterase [Cyclobacteriaceae bacterium]
MNFLAHAYLSGNDKKILVGNFIADFVKGKQALNEFEKPIIKGIALHRAIDAFTDTHEVVRESKDRLRPKYRHYSAVIVDVFYDHFLATHWKVFHHQSLADFAAATYQTIGTFSDVLPLPVKRMLRHMIKGNWFVGYSKVAGINQTLSGMASRTPYASKMEEATKDLHNHYENFQGEFERFFPMLKDFSSRWLEENI